MKIFKLFPRPSKAHCKLQSAFVGVVVDLLQFCSSKVQKYTTLAMSSKIVDTGLKEYSVIYTDRAINLLSDPFKKVMRNISATMKEVYNAHSVALIPGSGSYGMEAVARQYGTGNSVLIIRNG